MKEDLEAVVDEPNGDGVADENVEEPKAGAVDVAGGAPKAGVVEEAPPKLGTDDVPKGVEALAVPPKEEEEEEGAAEGVWAKGEEEAVEDVRGAPPNCVPKPGGCVADDDAGGAPNAAATVGPPKALADAEAGAVPPKAGAEAPNGAEDAG